MRLYHFTAEHLAKKIRTQGITRGALLTNMRPVRFTPNRIWLTSNPGWKQAWCDMGILIPYRRDDVRFTVDIPAGMEDRVMDRAEWEATMEPETARVLTMFGDPDNWYVFKGAIPRKWLTKTERKHG